MTDQAYQIQEKLAQLEDALTKKLPTIKTLLSIIHRALKKDPAVATILSEEECEILFRGLKKQTGVEIATTQRAKQTKKAISKMTVDDL